MGVSLLMFALAPEGVWIVTDTLATTMEGEPHLLASKCFTAPHLELAVAFTGVANVGQEWTQWVQSRVLASDIDMLDRHEPGVIRAVYAELEGPEDATATIYHLGFSLTENAYVGYIYRSTSDFESEELPAPCFAIKPPPAGRSSSRPARDRRRDHRVSRRGSRERRRQAAGRTNLHRRYERRADIHEAFLAIGCCLICHRRLTHSF